MLVEGNDSVPGTIVVEKKVVDGGSKTVIGTMPLEVIAVPVKVVWAVTSVVMVVVL